MNIIIPKRRRGRQSAAAVAQYQEELEEFCRQIEQIRSTLDFDVSARGWCYILEEHGATKGDFDTIGRLFTECRKNGHLPVDICAEDESRGADHIESLDDETPVDFAHGWIEHVRNHVHKQYNPTSLWESSDYYVEMWVEKVDLKSLFSDICKQYTIPLVNCRGWSCLNSRAAAMERFRERRIEGKQCVLLYCGDHDPAGLTISEFLRSNFESMSGATDYDPADLIIDRFGLNADFIDQQGLSWIEGLETSSSLDLADPEHAAHFNRNIQAYLARFGARKCEANALVVRPEAGRQLCLDAIRRYVPDQILADFELARAEAQSEAKIAIEQMLAA